MRQGQVFAHAASAALTALLALLATSSLAFAENAKDCPNGGTVRFGVEPYDTAPKLVPIYEQIGKLVGDKLGCPVEVYVATSYNAEIEAMRNGKLEIGEFGPLGYVLAHQVAKAEAVAASVLRMASPTATGPALSLTLPRASRPSPRSRGTVSHFPTRPRPRAIYFRPTGCARRGSTRTRISVRSTPGAIPRRSRPFIITRSMPANSTASSSNPPNNAATTTTAIWSSCGSRTRSRPTRLWCAATCPRILRSG